MNEKFLINPFDRHALSDYRQLAGRGDEFRQIRFRLRNAALNKSRIKSILITGERGVGKTSFLNLIEAECDINNLIPVRVDLTESNSSNSFDFFWHLFRQAINKLFSLNIFDGKGGDIDAMIQAILNGDGIADQANWVFNSPILRKNYINNKSTNFEFHLFVEDLRVMLKELAELEDSRFNEKTKILFLVDESQHIYSNRKIIEELRFVMQSHDLGVGFVFAGDSTFKTSLWEKVFGGSYRDFEIINLKYFDDVESVIDFFKKSLSTINWTDNEIEETLFYKFKIACRQIFNLTSGKPAWINTIASKMFERCMSEEVRQMRFDKQAQNNVKQLLEDSGELDKSKLEFIESLSPKYEKWLAEIFACELNTFNQVYFFAKFILSNEYHLELDEYESFCKDLILKRIISVIEREQVVTNDSNSSDEMFEFFEQRYYSFDIKSDTIKQWLQISSDGLYSFRFDHPSRRFMSYINDQLVTEKNNAVILNYRTKESNVFRLKTIVEQLNNRDFDANDETYQFLSFLFKACKKLEDSRDREILCVGLRDLISEKVQSWNAYNYNDKNKIIGFRDSPTTIQKIKLIVEKYNNEQKKYEIEVFVDRVPKPDLNFLQKMIIATGDTKKIGIILDDKMDDMIRFYITDSNVEMSYDVALFFYKLFEEGVDLSVRDLNNTSYVFIAKSNLDKAMLLLSEAKRKITIQSINKGEYDSAALVLYNIATAEIMKKDLPKGLSEFKILMDFLESKEVPENSVGALRLLNLDTDNNSLTFVEVRQGDRLYPIISCKAFAEKNIELLKEYLGSNLS